MGEPAVVARDLRKRYGEFEALKGVSFEVPSGRVFGFLGPNGAGKSTTMRMMYGLSPITSGDLRVLGLDVTTHAREVKRRIGVVPQESNLDTDMTAEENLLTHARFYDVTGRAARETVARLLDLVQLTEKKDARVWELSGGMKRRLLIARALVNDPELLILDEPTVGLDPQSRALLWDRIRDLRRQGKTVVITTHYMDEAERLADDLLLIDGGRIVAEGTPKDLVRETVGKEVVEVELAEPDDEAKLLEALEGLVTSAERVGMDLILHADDTEGALEAAVESGITLKRAGLRRATLEDAFLKLTGRKLSD